MAFAFSLTISCKRLSQMIRVFSGFVLILGNVIASPNFCQCAPAGSPCEEFGEATAIFIGSIHSSEVVKSGMNYVITPERVFKGRPEESVLFFSCFDCMYCGWGSRFSIGERYLIYADLNSSGVWNASACGRTRPIAEADEDIEFLENLPSEGSGAHLYGTLLGIDSGRRISMAGAIITVEGSGLSYTTTATENEQYDMVALIPGEYNVSFKVLENENEYAGYTRRVRLHDRGCSRLNFLCIRDESHRRFTYK